LDHSIVHGALGGRGMHREGFKQLVLTVREALQPFHAVVDHILVEGDFAALRNRARGTHSGMFFGVPPTGRTVEWSEMAILRIGDGKILATWFDSDIAGLMQQLGVGQQEEAASPA